MHTQPYPVHRALRWCTIGASLSLIVLGVLVLIGWHIAAQSTLVVAFGEAPMHPGTALALLLCGVGCLAFSKYHPRWPVVGFVGAALIGALALLERVASVNLGASSTLAVLALPAQPYPIAPNTALGLVCGAGALLVLHAAPPFPRRGLVAAILSAAVAICASVALFGYLFGVSVAYAWGEHAQMPQLSVVGLLALSVAGIAGAWANDLTSEAQTPPWLSGLVLAAVLATTLSMAAAIHIDYHAQQKAATQAAASAATDLLELALRDRLHALERMAHRWSTHGGIPQAEWAQDATRYLADYPGYLAIAVVRADGTTRYVVPQASEAGAGRVAGTEQDALLAATQFRQGHAFGTVSTLRHGEAALAVALPLHMAARPDGFLIATIDVSVLLDSVLHTQAPGYAIAVYEGSALRYCRCAPQQAAHTSDIGYDAPLALPDATWRLRTSPDTAAGGITSPLVPLTLVLGATIVVLLGGTFAMARKAGVANRDLYRQMAAREQAEDALRTSEARYRSVVAALSEGIVVQNADGAILTCNASAERVLGLSADQLCGRTSIDPRWHAVRGDGSPFPGEDHPAMVALRTGQPQQNVIMGVYKPDDTQTWLSVNAQPLLLPGEDTPQAVVASFFDITEQRNAEARLRYQKTLLECQSEASAEGILVVGADRHWRYVNRRFAELWSLPDEVVAAGRSAVVLPVVARQTADPDSFMHWVNAAYTEPFRSQQREISLADGRVFECYTAPVHDGELLYGRAWYYRDITERKAVERMKSEFIGVVSHELRTPLTSIRGALGLINGGVVGDLPPRAREMVAIAHKNSERLVRLINDILDIEKLESSGLSLDLKPLSLAELAAQAVEANGAFAAQFGVSLVLAQPLPAALIAADADRLMQVLANLLSNAAKFAPRDSCVEVALAIRGGSACVSVTDHGAGISEAFRARIFQKFAQADSADTRKKGGTGLGLSIVKAIVEAHGGEISFTSAPGCTTFTVALPLIHEPSAPAAPAHEPAPAAHILVCEDDPDIATVLAQMLRDEGYTTDVAYTSSAARAQLAARHYDGMTLDLGLPEQDGLSLLRELRDAPHTAMLPVVVVSAHLDQQRRGVTANALGVSDWLEKPVDAPRLLAAVRRVMQRNNTLPRILHIEDDADIARVIATLLHDQASVTHVAGCQAALTALGQQPFDLALLDLQLPDGSGETVLTLLRQRAPTLPVVLFSVNEASPALASQVAAALVKSRTDERQLMEVIAALIPARAAQLVPPLIQRKPKEVRDGSY